MNNCATELHSAEKTLCKHCGREGVWGKCFVRAKAALSRPVPSIINGGDPT